MFCLLYEALPQKAFCFLRQTQNVALKAENVRFSIGSGCIQSKAIGICSDILYVCNSSKLVGIANPENCYKKYPYELSGGMQQRVMIAMTLACEPALLIADEPTTALDVTIQEQILDLIAELNEKMGMSVLFIIHDLGAMAQLCHSVRVMYLGTLVEEAETEELFTNTLHPYTKALFASVPDFERKERKVSLTGELPQYTDDFRGCVFHTRCPYACDKCRQSAPEMKEVKPGHRVACHLVDK